MSRAVWFGIRLGYFSVLPLVLLFASALAAQSQSRVFPQQPILLSPPDSAILQFPSPSIPIRFEWEPVEGATQYQVNVTVGRLPRSPRVTINTSISIDLNLTANDRTAVVQWSVRSGNAQGFSNEAVNIFRFTFGNNGTPVPTPLPSATPTPLPPPLLLSPKNNANVDENDALSNGIMFDWSDVTGAAKYKITIYENNEVWEQGTVTQSQYRSKIFFKPIFDVFQWDVLALNSVDREGRRSQRSSFNYGANFPESFPTPTPYPVTPDLSGDGRVTAEDFYRFAALFATNDPRVDTDNSGINENRDVVRFLQLYAAGK